jgi:hypothetical protein
MTIVVPVPLPSFEIENMEYATSPDGIEALRIDFVDAETKYIPNGDYTFENKALRVMAYIGVSPSTLDEAEGKELPMKVDHEGNTWIPQNVVQKGAARLQEAQWFGEAFAAS